MLEKSRQRMIDGVNKMSGRANCGEAVPLQQRSRAAVLALGIAFVVVMTAVSLAVDFGPIVAGGIAGLVVGGGINLLSTTYWLGYCDGEIFLVKTNRLGNKPVELTAHYTYPVPSSPSSGFLVKRVQIAGADYLVAKLFEERMRSIIGT